jgi:uncharacterized protein (PEP-CTERM system associated)
MGERNGVRPRWQGVCRIVACQMPAALALGALLWSGLPTGAAAQYLYNPPTPATTAATAPITTGAAQAATPPAWQVLPSLGVGESFTDNVNLSPPGQTQSDLITAVTPGLEVIGQTARLQTTVNFDPQILFFALGSSPPLFQPNLTGTAHAEVVPDTFFFDSSASISQQFVNLSAPVAPTTLTTSNNLQTTTALNASPYLDHHFGDYADTETRYRFSYTTAGGNAEVGGTTIAPETYNEFSQTIKGGDYFGTLGWTLTGDYNRTSGLTGLNGISGGTTGSDTYVTLDLSYPIYERLSATGMIGWEHLVNSTITTQSDGPIWNIGLRYDPSPYFSVSGTVGQRYGGTDYTFNLKYDVGPETHVNASYTQTVTTTQQLLANNVNGFIIGPNGLIINPQTGLPVAPGSLPLTTLGLSNGSYLDKHFEIDATATRERNTYNFTTYIDSQSEQVQASNTQSFAGTASWTRQLWPDLTSTLGASYTRVNFLDGSGRADNYYFANAGLTYSLSATASVSLTYVRSDRRSNEPGDDLLDDLVTLSVTKRF